MRSRLVMLPLTATLLSCSSPPKPPAGDEATRRPANAALAVELQACQSSLKNTQIAASESSRLFELTTAHAARLESTQRASATAAATRAGNSVFTVYFNFGETRAVVPADVGSALVDSARTAPLVFLRGRTDGSIDSAAESRIARERAAAVRDYLVAAGIPAARIRTTYQPSGDPVGENSSEGGRRANRRVEVEIYRVLPVPIGPTNSPRL